MNISKTVTSKQYKIPFSASQDQAKLPNQVESSDFYREGSWQVEQDGEFVPVDQVTTWMAGLKGEGSRARFVGRLPDKSRPLSEFKKKSIRRAAKVREGLKAASGIGFLGAISGALGFVVASALGPIGIPLAAGAIGLGLIGSSAMVREAKEAVEEASSQKFETKSVPVDGQLRRVEDSMIFQTDKGSPLVELPVSAIDIRSATPDSNDSGALPEEYFGD